MTEQEFLEHVQEELTHRLGADTKIKLQEIRKNNNVLYKGFIVQRPESNVAPTIYMNAFFEMYQEGESLKRIVDRVMEVYERGQLKTSFDMDFFMDFEKVKDRIAFRVINANRNEVLLEQIPHILFLDLAICFYYAFYNEEVGDGMIMIHNNHMEMWETTVEELMRLARVNTQRLFPPVCATMDSVLGEWKEPDMDVSLLNDFYVLTNSQKSQGAVNMLYPDYLESMAEKMNGSFYIIPSSIHEVILVKDQGNESAGFLHQMILQANSTQLQEEEILSDYPYYYNKSEKKLTQIRNN